MLTANLADREYKPRRASYYTTQAFRNHSRDSVVEHHSSIGRYPSSLDDQLSSDCLRCKPRTK